MSIWHWRRTNIRLCHWLKFGEKTRLLSKRRPTSIGVARGCTGCTCIPQGGEKNWGPNLRRKVVSAPPPPGRECIPPRQSRSPIFKTIGRYGQWGRLLRQFQRVFWGRRLKKGRQLFREGKVHPRQNPGYGYAYFIVKLVANIIVKKLRPIHRLIVTCSELQQTSC